MTSEPRTLSPLIHAAIWLVGGTILLIYSIGATSALLKRAKAFSFLDGAEQSVLIFLFAAVASLIQARAQFIPDVRNSWLGKILALPLLLGSFIWLFFGGWAHEPWPFSSAVACVLVASVWQVFMRKQ